MTILRKPGIPSIQSIPAEIAVVLRPMKENIELLTGARGGAIVQLQVNATTVQIVSKINEIIARLNQAGS